MKKRFPIMFIVVAALLAPLGAWMYSTFTDRGIGDYVAKPWEKPASLEDIVDDVLADREASLEAGGEISFGSEEEINVLVLGLDGRKGWNASHCDAIHMYTLNVVDWTMKITSVPRGTYANLPGDYPEHEYYVANACGYGGLDYGIEQIERIVGVQADYVVTVGFSQTLGVLRQLGLPTTESLQWLRHRQSFAIGDPQRSRNQAQFMKDLILTQGDKLRSGIAAPMQYVLYSTVNTDMPYSTARALVEGFLEADIDARPDDIALDMKPYHATQEMHLDLDNPEPQIQALLARLEGRLSEEDLSGTTLESVQQDLIDYLDERLDAAESIDDVVEKQLWLQVEDTQMREEFHFAFIERYITEMNQVREHDQIVETLSNYTLEKQTLGYEDYADKGKELMANYIKVEL